MENSKLLRVSKELAQEIEEGAKRNQMRITQYSKEVAKLLRQNKNKKTREITF